MTKEKAQQTAKESKKKTPEGRPARTALPGERLTRPRQALAAAGIIVCAILVMYPELVFQNRVFLASDTEAAASFATPVQKEMKESGGYPMWNPYLFAGMPSYESLSYNPYVYPVSTVTAFLTSVLRFPNSTWLLFHIFLLGFGVFLVLWDRGVNFLVAAFAGVAMMWMPHHVAVGAYGHGSQANAIAYIPYALFFWDRIWRGKALLANASALVIVLGFQLLRAHIQISYYTFALLGLHTLFFGAARIRAAVKGGTDSEYPAVSGFLKRALRRDRLPARKLAVLETWDLVFVFALVVVGALLVSAVLLLPVREYAPYSIRGASEAGGLDYGYATSWSLHPAESLTFLVPFSFGFGKIIYHGHMPFTDYANYLGLVVFLFAGFAVALARSRFVWFLVFVIVATTFVSFGKYFPLVYNPLFKWLPYFDKFRVPVMVLIVQHFAFALLFAIGLAALLRSDKPWLKRAALWGMGGAAALLLVCIITPGYWTGGFAAAVAKNITAVKSSADQLQLAKLSGAYLFKDLVKTSLVLLSAFGLIWLFVTHRMSARVFLPAVCLVAAVDLYIADLYVLHPERLYPKGLVPVERVSIIKDKRVRDRFLEPDSVVSFLLARGGGDGSSAGAPGTGYRVFPVFHPSAPLVGGDFTTNRFMNFGISSVGGYHPAKLGIYADFIKALETAAQRSNYHMIDVMNARYVVASHPFPNVSQFEPLWEGADYDGRRHLVYENKSALPRAFLAGSCQVFTPDEMLALLPTLPANGIDLSETVLLEKEPAVRPVSASGAEAVIRRFSLNEIRVDAKLRSPAILVLSEVFYPKWKVTVDGAEAELLKADYVLRAVALPAGDHEVVFHYDSSTLKRGLLISVLTLGAAVAVLVASSAGAIREKLQWKR
jgi:hypothetical protein